MGEIAFCTPPMCQALSVYFYSFPHFILRAVWKAGLGSSFADEESEAQRDEELPEAYY